MFEGPKEEFYIDELRTALTDYVRVSKELRRMNEERRQKTKMIKNIISILKMHIGETGLRNLVERFQMQDAVRPFLTISTLHTAGTATVVRRRRGEKKVVDPATVVPKGTKIRMMTGNYEGQAGVISYSQAKEGRKGLDVTYFLNLTSPDGTRHRTSVKHGTMNKTWEVMV